MGETEGETIGYHIHLEIVIFYVCSHIRYIIPWFKVGPSLYNTSLNRGDRQDKEKKTRRPQRSIRINAKTLHGKQGSNCVAKAPKRNTKTSRPKLKWKTSNTGWRNCRRTSSTPRPGDPTACTRCRRTHQQTVWEGADKDGQYSSRNLQTQHHLQKSVQSPDAKNWNEEDVPVDFARATHHSCRDAVQEQGVV